MFLASSLRVFSVRVGGVKIIHSPVGLTKVQLGPGQHHPQCHGQLPEQYKGQEQSQLRGVDQGPAGA